MTITWIKLGAVIAAVAPAVYGGIWISKIDTKVESDEQQIAVLAGMPEAISRIDERTIAIQRSIDEIKSKLNKE